MKLEWGLGGNGKRVNVSGGMKVNRIIIHIYKIVNR